MITDPSWYLPFKALFTFSALLFQPFWSFYQVSGQTTPMVFLLLVLALVLRHRNHAVGPAICLVAVAAIKGVIAPGLLFLLVVSERKFRISLLAWTVFAALFSLPLMGIPLHVELATDILRNSTEMKPSYNNSNLFTFLEPFLISAEKIQARDLMPFHIRMLTTFLRLAVVAGLAVCRTCALDFGVE